MVAMLRTYLRSYTGREEGATAVEYGIMVALIAVVIIAAVFFLGEELRDLFMDVGTAVEQRDGSVGD